MGKISAGRMELVGIDKLVPCARNSRTHSKEQILQLRSSLREYGFVNPILITADNSVISGHGRLLAAIEEGYAEVPCVYVEHLTEAQKRAYILADNRLAQNAGWDEQLLALELGELKDMDFDLTLTGFDPKEIEALFAAASPEIKEDDFDVDAASKEPVLAQRGDVCKLGKHTLLCGDSTIPEDVHKLMGGAKAKCVFIDPPWNVDYGSDQKHPSWKPRTIMNDKMSTDKFGAFLLSAFKCVAEVSESGCMMYCVMSAQEWGNVMIALYEAGYHWSSTIIWAKDSLVLSRKDYHTQYEPI
ncbi:MAG: site-specific DNA-methyltransferase, partial [Firmicutes bacterium]|nr:site-specific DNA-methyltransferase [Bacillota bacterium]